MPLQAYKAYDIAHFPMKCVVGVFVSQTLHKKYIIKKKRKQSIYHWNHSTVLESIDLALNIIYCIKTKMNGDFNIAKVTRSTTEDVMLIVTL